MKIVIDISETPKNDHERWVLSHGTPLPKGHGRLIDIGKYEKEYFNVKIQYDDGNHIHSVYTNMIPTIIEADKESEDEYAESNN